MFSDNNKSIISHVIKKKSILYYSRTIENKEVFKCIHILYNSSIASLEVKILKEEVVQKWEIISPVGNQELFITSNWNLAPMPEKLKWNNR